MFIYLFMKRHIYEKTYLCKDIFMKRHIYETT